MDFLALGTVTGFFFLEQLVYGYEAAVEYLFDYELFLHHSYFGVKPPESDREELAAQRELTTDFGLAPWASTHGKLRSLLQTWASSVQLA